MEPPVQTEPKKSNTGLMIGIGVAVVFLLMCCCAIVVIGFLTVMGPVVGKTFSTINSIQTISPMMTMPADFPTISPDATMPSISDMIPTGGNGDDVQRTQAWAQVFISAAVSGCSIDQTSAPQTKIKVTQEANADGVWVEEWTVPCNDGSSKAFTVTFTPGKSGDTDIQVK